jgi:uncharacterized protein YfdQ (DUF2303 family)
MAEELPNVPRELIEYLVKRGEAEIIPLDEDVSIAAVPAERKLQSLKPFLDEYLTAPERKKGTATVTDLTSFIALTLRGQDENSVIFAKRDPAQPRLVSVLNYNQSGGDDAGAPRYGDHRVVYPFPVSKEWQAWQAKNGSKMSQGDFAEFLEDRIADVMEPPTGQVIDGGSDAVHDLSKSIGGTFAGPARLMELSRGMTVSANNKVAQAVNLGSGEMTIQFAEEHHDEKGKPLKVPSLFVIAIPIFDRGPLYRIGVRLRYRISGGNIVWFYELYRADKSFDHAFDEACMTAAQETTLPLFYGTPEV